MELIQGLGTPDAEAIAKAVADYLIKNPLEETDPTVPEWAKAEKKPTYTAEEVGAIANTYLQTAINSALAQAKTSGEFDGAKGDPGKAATIQVGEVTTGAAGTPASVSNVGTDEAAIFDFTIPRGEKGADGADGKTAYAYAVEGGYTGTEAEFAAKLAEEMPTTLPNPNALTFTGAVTGSYDGSDPVSVNIPSAVTDDHINSLIDTKLGVIENGSY